MLRRLFFGLFLLCLPATGLAQKIQEISPPQEYTELYAQVVSWERFYAKLLGLDAWTIEVQFDTLPRGYLAGTESHPATRLARTSFDPRQLALELEPWNVVLHELLHVFTAHLHGFAWNLAPDRGELTQYLFEDLVQRMVLWPVWPKLPKE